MVLVGSEAYLFGGATSINSLADPDGMREPELGALLNDLWKYNFEENPWNEVRPANPPQARAWNASAAYDNLMYVFWGSDSVGGRIDNISLFNATNNVWAPAPSSGEVKPPPSTGTMAVPLGDFLYVFGGFPNESGMWSYRPSDGHWVERQWFEQWTPQNASMGAVGNNIYLFGGITDSYQNAIWKFDPAANKWSNPNPQAPLPAKRAYAACATDSDSMWIFGGEGQGFEQLKDVWQYHVQTNTWTRWPDLPDVRVGGTAVRMPGKSGEFVLFGGYRGNTPIAETYVYKTCTITCNASASPSSGMAPLAVQFSADYTPSGCPSGTPTTKWDFGDGSSAEGTTSSHVYEKSGTFAWSFTVSIGAYSCIKRGEVKVAENPCTIICNVMANPTQGRAPITVNFIASVVPINCDGERSVLWDFGDGTTSQEESPSHLYAKGGRYNWRYQVTIGNTTCTNEGLVEFTGQECTLRCIVDDVPDSAKMPVSIPFYAQVVADTCSAPPVILWTFGDGQTSDQSSSLHSYSAPGTYNWSFHAEVDGQSCDRAGTIVILPPCVVTCECSASPTSGRAPLTVHFEMSVTGENCTGEPSLLLMTGDEGTYDGTSADHTYTKAGTYTWNFMTYLNGIPCSKTGTIKVEPPIPGDGNGDGKVSIGEVQQGINMFLGQVPPGNNVDGNADGVVSIGELQKVINAFLGLT